MCGSTQMRISLTLPLSYRRYQNWGSGQSQQLSGKLRSTKPKRRIQPIVKTSEPTAGDAYQDTMTSVLRTRSWDSLGLEVCD